MLIIKILHVLLKCDKVLIWRLIIEDYVPEIEYIKGYKNIVADTQ